MLGKVEGKSTQDSALQGGVGGWSRFKGGGYKLEVRGKMLEANA